MSNISYGQVHMRVNQIQQDVRPVYTPDGVDYLYTHIRTSVTCVWQPFATTDTNGAVGAVAIENLRATLMTPRLPLIISVPSGGAGGTSLLLRSPLRDPDGIPFNCDAKNGPLPVGEPIIQIVGERMVLVQWIVETWVVECSATMRAILSHRWEMEEHVDIDLYTTRTITGECYFRSDWMETQTTRANADDFRTYLFHPIPDMFRRTDIRVKASSDNTKLSYVLTDREIAGRVKATEYPNITQAYGWYTRATNQANAGTLFGNLIATVTDPQALARIAFDGVSFPSITLNLEVHIHGSRFATMTNLANAASNVLINFRFKGQQVFGLNVSGYLGGVSCTYSMAGERKVIVRASAKFSLGAIVINDLLGVGPGGTILDNEDLTNVTPVTTRDVGVAGGNPFYGSYGSALERMVVQTLNSPCITPDPPPAASPNPVQARTP